MRVIKIMFYLLLSLLTAKLLRVGAWTKLFISGTVKLESELETLSVVTPNL